MRMKLESQKLGLKYVAIGAALISASCLHVADDRAERDRTVGRARIENAIDVTVDDGLATIRQLERSRVALWAQAPTVTMRITPVGSSVGSFEVNIENVLPDAVLTATSESGDVIDVIENPSSVPTEKRWTLAIPETGPVRVALSTPDANDLEPWTFGIFGDVQDAIDDVQDVYAKMNEEPDMRFVVIAGDLTQQGTRSQLERFQRELKGLERPCFATLGNHELGDDELLFHEYYGRGSYRFVYRGLQITLVDSASATISPRVYDWLEGWLEEGKDRLHLVTMHIPPLDPVGVRNGSFTSRLEADKLLTMLADGNVDMTVYGHIHSYYAFSNASIPSYITGGGGAIPERMDGIGRHFLKIRVDPQRALLQPTLIRVDNP